jgi:hydroxymethylglutaryl-CoA synthase
LVILVPCCLVLEGKDQTGLIDRSFLMGIDKVGISGFAVYIPPYRVDLRRWCEWTGNCWEKISKVVGTGFRMLGPGQSVYTMAATAVLRLIDQYDIDPRRIRFLALGTESSTDNSAGAIIVKGMLDGALQERGDKALSRHCEVPEIKHACLGGVYAMKHALRFLATEPGNPVAIVVSADIAKYELGCSGEATQGAGAVAMLLEKDPALLEVDFTACGSASDYRAVDFRKPMVRSANGRTEDAGKFRDTPVFNGKYSTSCYLDETVYALKDMLRKLGRQPAEYYQSLTAVFMHRPYERMPVNSLGFSYLYGLAYDGVAGKAELADYCSDSKLSFTDVVHEMQSVPDILSIALDGDLNRDPYPMTMQLLRDFRQKDRFKSIVEEKMTLGTDAMRELGNIYSAALPAWMAAGMEAAWRDGVDLTGKELLVVGYGSGDAAEAIPMRTAEKWRDSAGRIEFTASLAPSEDLDREQYLSLHRSGEAGSLPLIRVNEFIVDRVGSSKLPDYVDDGIEFYRYVNGA